MPTRRDVLRLLGLAVLATSAASLTACGEETSSGVPEPGLVAARADRASGDASRIPAVVESLHRLTGGLYAQIATEGGNLALSPYSVAVALAMSRNGALGRTAKEMDEVLGIKDLAAHNDGLNALTKAVEGLAGSFEQDGGDPAVIALDSANALFGDKSVGWADQFLDALARSYGAGMRTVDYIEHTEDARAQINAWTADRTHDKIPEILPEGVVDTLTRLVLVNALYFKAPWQTPFDESFTADRVFHRSQTDAVDVPTMSVYLSSAGHGQGPSWQAVRIPYAGSTLAMTVVLPDVGALADVEQQVSDGGLGAILGAHEQVAVRLRLPRWRFRTQASLTEVLGSLGMPTAFTDQADFTGMTDEVDLHVGAVLHETFVAVDEKGTEAAAATAVAMEAGSAPAQPLEVDVDRPFLFVIHDVEHLTPLFVGRVVDPSA